MLFNGLLSALSYFPISFLTVKPSAVNLYSGECPPTANIPVL